jgi:hypothetical protein
VQKRLTPSERDGRWFKEWVEYGLEQLEESLAKHAAFDQYLVTHPRKEVDDHPDSD